jgi:hypothetical protein
VDGFLIYYRRLAHNHTTPPSQMATGARAALATKLLNEIGYKNAVRHATGMADWAKSGYPVQTSFTDEELILLPAEE